MHWSLLFAFNKWLFFQKIYLQPLHEIDIPLINAGDPFHLHLSFNESGNSVSVGLNFDRDLDEVLLPEDFKDLVSKVKIDGKVRAFNFIGFVQKGKSNT